MANTLSQLGGIAGGMIMNIVRIVAILVFAVVLFYSVRFIQKNVKKQKSFNTNAIIIDLNGVIDFDKLAFVKNDVSGLLEMQFQNRKTDSIPPIAKHLIKGNNVLLLNFAPGHYAVIDTSSTMNNFNKGIFKIIPFNLGMKKYIISRQRELLNKAEDKKRKWELYLPWFTLIITILAACVLAFLLMYFGANIQSANIDKRILECKEALG